MTNSQQRQAMAELLRTRRTAISPEDVGLVPGPRRFEPGLRREEVAELANISTAYYTYLEQARPVSPSPQVVAALAQVLQLSPTETDDLDGLARRQWHVTDPDREHLLDGVVDMVESLEPAPAFVLGRCWDVLVANQAARELFWDWGGEERNVIRWMFTDLGARRVYVDWEPEARALLARFRAAFAQHAELAAMRVLVESLLSESREARAWWGEHPVAPSTRNDQLLRHPRWGESVYRRIVLRLADAPDQTMVSYSLAPTNGVEANGVEASGVETAAPAPRHSS